MGKKVSNPPPVNIDMSHPLILPPLPPKKQKFNKLLLRTILNIICFIVGHRYYVIKEFSLVVRKVGCRRCYKEWGMHDEVRVFIEWDSDLENLHKEGCL